jgi:hypothetical protein
VPLDIVIYFESLQNFISDNPVLLSGVQAWANGSNLVPGD